MAILPYVSSIKTKQVSIIELRSLKVKMLSPKQLQRNISFSSAGNVEPIYLGKWQFASANLSQIETILTQKKVIQLFAQHISIKKEQNKVTSNSKIKRWMKRWDLSPPNTNFSNAGNVVPTRAVKWPFANVLPHRIETMGMPKMVTLLYAQVISIR